MGPGILGICGAEPEGTILGRAPGGNDGMRIGMLLGKGDALGAANVGLDPPRDNVGLDGAANIGFDPL
jgi:hypothetical protein